MDFVYWRCRSERYAQLGDQLDAEDKEFFQKARDVLDTETFCYSNRTGMVIGIRTPRKGWRTTKAYGNGCWVPNKRTAQGKVAAKVLKDLNANVVPRSERILEYIRQETDPSAWGAVDDFYPVATISNGVLFVMAPDTSDLAEHFYPTATDWEAISWEQFSVKEMP